jgi:hypothetical protein
MSSYLRDIGWYGDHKIARGSTKTLIRSVAIQVVAATSYGHLMSLRNSTNRPPSIVLIYLVSCILFPLLPLAQLLRQIAITLCVVFKRRHFCEHLRLYLSGILGIEATSSQLTHTSDSILKHPFASLGETRSRYNLVWMGRMIVLAALNSTLSHHVAPFYPIQLQWDIEFAYSLHILFYAYFSMEGGTVSSSGFEWKIQVSRHPK